MAKKPFITNITSSRLKLFTQVKNIGAGLLFVSSLTVAGQQLSFDNVRRLPSAINSDAEESMPLLSPDGKTLYFNRTMHPENIGGQFSGSDAWISRKDQLTGAWTQASNRKMDINNRANNAIVGLNRTGDVVYLLNTYSTKATKGIYFVKGTGNTWSKPEFIPIPGLAQEGFIGAYVSPDFDIILLSMKREDSRGEEDIYVTLRDSKGVWSEPKNLGQAINTPGFEISPYLSSDKKRIYFASNGHPGMGDADIFYSDRLYESWETWSTPRNLGDKVNTTAFEAYYSMYGDSVAFFSSNRTGKLADLYTASVSLDFRKEEPTKRYLTTNEVNELVGPAPMEIKFDRNVTKLNAAQNELLFYIYSKTLTKSDIKIQLLMNEDEDNNLTQARETAVAEKLKALGIANYRLELSTFKNDKARPTPEGMMKIQFYR